MLRSSARWGLDAVVVGRVTGDGRMRIRLHGETVVDIPVDPVAAELARARPARARARRPGASARSSISRASRPRADLTGALRALLDAPEPRLEGVDLAPVRSARAGQHGARPRRRRRARAREARGRHADRKALALSVDCNPRWCWLDPYAGTVAAVAEAARNVACTGARPLALTNCLNFGNPEKPEIMWEFARGDRAGSATPRARSARRSSRATSRSTTRRTGRAIYPTPTIAVVGPARALASATPSSHFTAAGHAIVLLGETREELGGSEWLALRRGLEAGMPPRVDLEHERRLRRLLARGVASGRVATRARRRRDGGLAVALARVLLRRARRAIGARGRARRRAAARRAAVRRVDRPRDRRDARTPARCSRAARAAAYRRARSARPAAIASHRRRRRARPGSTSRSLRCTRSGRARDPAAAGGRVTDPRSSMTRSRARELSRARERDRFHDECGVFGVHGHPEAANDHLPRPLRAPAPRPGERGHRARTRAASSTCTAAMGLVADVFNERHPRSGCPGRHAIGHVRYSTAGGSSLRERAAVLRQHRRAARSRSRTTATS